MKKILVISWFFPPINSSEGLVTYKLLKASKNKYDVFSQNSNISWSYGNDDIFPECKNINIIHAKANDLETWKKEAIKYFEKSQDKYDVIMTRSMPPESHEVGLEIKKRFPDIKWISSFGDPIFNNPYTLLNIQKSMSPFSLKQRYMRKMKVREIISLKRIVKNFLWNSTHERGNDILEYKNFQNEILNNSDMIIFNSAQQQNYMTNHISCQNKSIILPHSYDEKLYSKIHNKNNESNKIRMAYIGHLDNIRTPRLLLKAILQLKQNDKYLSDKFILEFYGNMSDKDKLFIINNDMFDVIKIKQNIGYLESLKIMQEVDWLVHIDANLNNVLEENIFFAAKLADYIGAKTNIFALTMFDGASYDVLKNVGALITSFSVSEIENYMYLIIYKNHKIQMNEEKRKLFSNNLVAKKFDDHVKKITHNNC